jgi:ABC-type polysaccharide/polyol phosphate transport system ATPase subunit
VTAPAISFDRIGKRYRIGARAVRHRTASEALAAAAQGALRRLTVRRGDPADDPTLVWALRDVTLDVAHGEAVAVVGGNGAGKSTLLKLLSRITEPTAGRGTVRGRVGSLLEVGTGFHPELTGRENIQLNGAILGMPRREIAAKFDEIVEFAEVGRFIDTPVKRFSSGMYLRLAFAVAAHLEPDILLVDEVLAVGDASFQKKCLGKMQDVAGGGRTVLFVSHNLEAVQRLCPRSVLLDRGRLVADGATADVLGRYLQSALTASAPETWIDLQSASRVGTGRARFAAARYTSGTAATSGRPHPNGPLDFTLAIESREDRLLESLAVSIKTTTGILLVNADVISLGTAVPLRRGRNLVSLRIDALHLTPGDYVVALWMSHSIGETFDFIESAFGIDVVAHAAHGDGGGPKSAVGLVPCRFHVHRLGERE